MTGMPGAPYRPEPGPHAVRTERLRVARGAMPDLELTVRVPVGAGGPRPAIVFSHGAMGSAEDYGRLSCLWAAWGYAVVQPRHADSLDRPEEMARRLGVDLATVARQGAHDPEARSAARAARRKAFAEIRSARREQPDGRARARPAPGDVMRGLAAMRRRIGGAANVAKVGRLVRLSMGPGAWSRRIDDAKASIDALGEVARRCNVPIDGTRVGVGGHSYGAFVSQVIGGATLLAPGDAAPVSLADARARAVLLLSAQGRALFGLVEGSWDGLDRPMMNVTGTLDRGIGRRGLAWKREPYEASPPGCKYQLVIDGADHMLGGIPDVHLAFFQEDPLHRRIVEQASLAFWDAFVAERVEAREWLDGNGFGAFVAGAAELSRK